MSVQLFNTMSRQQEVLKPLHKNSVSLYTCGPTVYHYLQIGNWAAFLRWDLLVRMLRLNDYKVNWVMNITDVGHLTSDADEGEDKLEKGARREGKNAWEIAEFYTQDFLQGLRQLNIQLPTQLVKATDHIQEQIKLTRELEEKGFTYIIDDGVYFDTSKLSDYGKLAQLKDVDLRAGARVELNPQKRNTTDFALWKFSPKEHERDMEWDSPWGTGFPGWHLECSAMAMKYLGETLDIHAGGIDHIPVHHTNEIAQSEAVTGEPFANLWLHSNFLTIDGTKLSKSLGNSYTLHDIIAKGYDPLDLRMLILQSHYRTQADFTWEALDAARQRRKNWQAIAELRFQSVEKTSQDTQSSAQIIEEINVCLSDDLNTPKALAIVDAFVGLLSDKLVSATDLKAFKNFFEFLDQAFGLKLLESLDISSNQKTLIAMRETARAEKDFTKADELRDELKRQGINLRDTSHGPIWYR